MLDTIITGDAREALATLPDESVHCCVTSPPYWGLRDYGEPGQLGLEPTPGEYVARLVGIFREVRRVLRGDGVVWLNLGSSYAGGTPGTGGSGEKSSKQATNRGAYFNASSRPAQNAGACGSDGTEPQDSTATDPACPRSDGERQGDSPRHRRRTTHTGPSLPVDAERRPRTSRDSVPPGSEPTSQPASLHGVLPSTTHASQRSALDACAPAGAALVCQRGLQTSSGDVPPCAGTSACNSCTAGIAQTSDHHMSDTGSSFSASEPPALTMLYSTIASLGFKQKDMVPIPWLVALALQADGWYLRSDIIWSKPNPMPESVKDRPTKAHEYLFLLSKSPRYFYDADAVREAGDPASANSSRPPTTGAALRESQGGLTRTTPVGRTCGLHSSGRRNRRSVWTIATQPFPGAHFAVMPPALVRPCVLAGCPVGGIVIDPFMGAGTVGVVAVETGRRYLGIELNPEYVEMARERIRNAQPVLPGFEPGRAANA